VHTRKGQAALTLLTVTLALGVRGDTLPQEVDGKIADGIVALTTQSNAVSLADISRAFDLDLSWYKPAESAGSTFNMTYWRREAAYIREKTPILYFTFTNVELHFAIPSVPGPAMPPDQSIKILLERGRCISVKTLQGPLHVQFKGYPPAINPAASRAAAPVATSTSESHDQPQLTYFARLAGHPGAGKTAAVENGLYLENECSQEIGISKTFDYDYWNSLCPFNYNERLIDSVVVPAMKQRYGSEYAEFAIQQPDLKDYGSFIVLRFYKSAVGPGQEAEFAMEVDRCTKKATRTWEVPAEAVRDRPLQ